MNPVTKTKERRGCPFFQSPTPPSREPPWKLAAASWPAQEFWHEQLSKHRLSGVKALYNMRASNDKPRLKAKPPKKNKTQHTAPKRYVTTSRASNCLCLCLFDLSLRAKRPSEAQDAHLSSGARLRLFGGQRQTGSRRFSPSLFRLLLSWNSFCSRPEAA